MTAYTGSTVPLAFEDYGPAAAHVAEHAPDAHELIRITECLDSELHTVWLDKGSGTVWHAQTTPGLDADGWTLDREPAAEAQKWIEVHIADILDRLADPETSDAYIYPGPSTSVEDDLEVLAEFEKVQLAALGALTGDPTAVDRIIRDRIDSLREESARLARLRGVNLAAAYGAAPFPATRAAEALGLSQQAATKVMAAPGAYAERARAGFTKACQPGG